MKVEDEWSKVTIIAMSLSCYEPMSVTIRWMSSTLHCVHILHYEYNQRYKVRQ